MDFSCQESELENIQNVADSFYCQAYELLEGFYPEREVVMTSRDPVYITPAIKVMIKAEKQTNESRTRRRSWGAGETNWF